MAAGSISVTPGIGDEVAFDKGLSLPGAVFADAQLVKKAVGGDGDFLGYQSGRSVDGTTDEAASFTEDRPDVYEFTSTLTIDTAAYSTGDQIGGLLTITDAAKATGGGVRVDHVTIIDQDAEAPLLDIVFFNDSITAPGNNVAFDLSDTDILKSRGVVPIATGDWTSFVDNAIVCKRDLNLVIPALIATSLYAILVIRTADTFTAATDISVAIAYTRL
jgi:hypothetical protein